MEIQLVISSRYMKIFPILYSSKYSSSQLYSMKHSILDFLCLLLCCICQKTKFQFQVKVPDLQVEKTLQFSKSSLIWEVKQQIIAALPKVREKIFLKEELYSCIIHKSVCFPCYFGRGTLLYHKSLKNCYTSKKFS